MDGVTVWEGLLERDAELAELSALCSDAVAGRGAVAVLQGPAGLGKTALLQAACATAARACMVVLSSSGAELERDLAFGVVRQLFERPLRKLSNAERAQLLTGAPGLARTVVLEPDPAPPRPDAAHAAMHGLYWLSVEMATRQPLVLAIDDLHWADAPSLRWIGYLSRRLEGVPLLVALACRDAEPGVDAALVDQILSDARADVLRPQPLSERAVERLLARAYDQRPSPAFVKACFGATGGNPLVIRELTDELRAENLAPDAAGAARVEGVACATIARSVLMRLARLGPDAVAIAEATAILSQDARLDRVAGLSGISVEHAGRITDALVASGILATGEAIAFAHPVLRTAVHEQIPTTRRGLAHMAAARRLIGDGGGTERAAGHLLPAPATGDPWVVGVLREAAAAALARGATESAVPLLRRALIEPPAEPANVLLELAGAEALARDAAAVGHARQAIAAAPTATKRARAALIAARALVPLAQIPEALQTLATAELDADDLDPALRLEVQMEALLTSAWTQGALGLDQRLTAIGVDRLAGDTPVDRVLLGLRAMELTVSGGAREHALELARRVLARANLADFGDERIVLTAGHALTAGDALDEAREASSALIDGGRARGAVASVAFGYGTRADVEFRAGRLTETEADAQQALQIAVDHGLGLLVQGALTHLVEALLEREAAPAALNLLARYGFGGDALPPGYGTHLLLHARACARYAAGDHAGAVVDFQACGRAQAAWGDRNPATIPWRSGLALALHSAGHNGEAHAHADEELRLARAFGAPRAVGIALRARALLLHGEAAIAGLKEAVATLADSPARLEHARALVDLGGAQRRAGRRTEARATLRAGLDAAHQCHAHLLSERARSELTAAGARPRRERLSGPDALTASELRVARLAAEGMTNRQIAQALFVTTKTIEMHLGRVYMKLGIAGRGALAAAVGDGRPDSAVNAQQTS
jgi:DNA-binding CsgD family transcriptional regulator